MDKALYSYQFTPPAAPFPLLAVDTETVLFQKETYGWNRKSRISPFVHPELVLASFADSEGNCYVLGRADTGPHLRARLLDPNLHLVFHASVFDIPVLCKFAPELTPLFVVAVEQGRVHDSRLLEPLIQIARGSRALNSRQLIAYPSLKDLAVRRAGRDLDKSPNIRLGFGEYLHNQAAIPPEFLRYASEDAEVTYHVFCSQWFEGLLYDDPAFCSGPRLPGHRARFGLLTEKVQVQGDLALTWLSSFPVRVDLAQATAIRERLGAESAAIQASLCSCGFGWHHKKTGVFHLRHQPIQAALALFAAERGILPPLTPLTLKVSLKYEDWAPILPKGTDPLSLWLRYMRLQKLLVTYIYPYSSAERHYPRYSTIGARTTRTSCSTPNIQNVPKRRDGIRSLFIPEPGMVLIERDYSAAELIALAQVYYCLVGGSVLGDAINSSLDPHIETARRMVPDFDNLPECERKSLRQAAKAVNFGLPGGLGAKTLAKYARAAWGLEMSEDDASNLREAALKADPQLKYYLSDIEDKESLVILAAANLDCTIKVLLTALDSWNDKDRTEPNYSLASVRLRKWRHGNFKPSKDLNIPINFDPKFDLYKRHVASPIGFVRGNCSFTEAHNTPFQSLVAAGAKIALWNLYVWWLKDPTLFQPVAFIHDSILIQCPLDKWERADKILEHSMSAGLKAVCPDITVKSDTTGPLERWGPSTDHLGGILACPGTTPTKTADLPVAPPETSSAPPAPDPTSLTPTLSN